MPKKTSEEKLLEKIEKSLIEPMPIKSIFYEPNEDMFTLVIGDYNVNFVDGFMACDCPDFFNRAGENPEGSYYCKHSIRALTYLVEQAKTNLERENTIKITEILKNMENNKKKKKTKNIKQKLMEGQNISDKNKLKNEENIKTKIMDEDEHLEDMKEKSKTDEDTMREKYPELFNDW